MLEYKLQECKEEYINGAGQNGVNKAQNEVGSFTPSGLSLLDWAPSRMALKVRSTIEFRIYGVILCLTTMKENRALKANCVAQRREYVDTGRYAIPKE